MKRKKEEEEKLEVYVDEGNEKEEGLVKRGKEGKERERSPLKEDSTDEEVFLEMRKHCMREGNSMENFEYEGKFFKEWRKRMEEKPEIYDKEELRECGRYQYAQVKKKIFRNLVEAVSRVKLDNARGDLLQIIQYVISFGMELSEGLFGKRDFGKSPGGKWEEGTLKIETPKCEEGWDDENNPLYVLQKRPEGYETEENVTGSQRNLKEETEDFLLKHYLEGLEKGESVEGEVLGKVE
jgi:hypothetical protein